MSTNASSPAALPGTTLRPKHGGRSALHLDAAPVRVGDWLSGVVEIPERFRGADLRLYVECVHRFEFNDLRSFRWYGIELLDGARLEHQAGKLFIPIAVQLPADAPPTSHDILNKQRVDWVLRVQAIRPGASYRLLFESEFEVAVEPSHEAAPPAPATTPRSMPLLTPEEVATRLDARASTVGDTLLIRFPFPAGAATTTFVAASVFALNGLAYVVPGLPWGLPLDPDVHLAIGVVSGGVAAVFLFILLSTARAVEVRPESVRIPRGILGLGFHTSADTRDVEEVLENPFHTPEANPTYFGVALRLKNGAPYNTATRMRDPASARALANLLSSVLPRR
ncbi:MAG: hypothetical protein IPN83_20795 [Holophagales bacterium]|jgi:hypothetical protein|nr:hypothetical protein [Holophagales bacterium]